MKRTDGPGPVTQEQYDILDRIAGGEPHLRAFLAHIFQRQAEPLFRDDGTLEVRLNRYVEIPCQTRRRLFRNASWRPLAEAYAVDGGRSGGLDLGAILERPASDTVIQTRGHWAEEEQCRGYRLVVPLALELMRRAPKTVHGEAGTVWVNPWNGRRVHRRLRSIKSTSNHSFGDSRSPLVRGALDVLTVGVYDVEQAEAWLRRERTALARRGVGLSRGMRRVWAAESCYRRGVLLQDPVVDGFLATYPLAYTVSGNGRIYQRGGGLQGVPGAMKLAAYGRVPGAADYDIRRSHLAGFLELAEGGGLPTCAVAELYDGPDDLDAVETRCGLVPGTLKSVVYPVMSGGHFPEPTDAAVRAVERGRRPKDSAVRAVLDGAALGDDGRPLLSFRERYERTYTALFTAFVEIRAWHRHLAEDYVPETCTSGRGGQYVTNACEMKLFVGRLESRPLTKQRAGVEVAPHLLQGLEAALIHALTVVLHERGVRVVSNEHDGAIIVGEVTAGDVARAHAASGFYRAELVRKW